MLTQTLRELEEDKLILRKMYHEVPPKVEYSLSETGQELIPFIAHLHAWAKKQMEMDAPSVGKLKDERTAAVCKSVCDMD
jgi:DNA-binding HxlR family transcriptional regulator